jgi:glutamate carboxypeptidase
MHRDEPIRFLERLCDVDSRTVAGAAGATRVAEMLGERLRALGFALEWVSPDPSEGPRGRHLLARRNPGAGTRLLFIGHTDTVLGPADAPFRLDESARRVCGAGANDMKGGCVLMLEALALALGESPAAGAAELVVLMNASEEISGPSFQLLARREAAGAAACLGFEPAGTPVGGAHPVIIARKGVVRFDLRCHGRAAHAGNDHAHGVNAIRELARKIERLESLTDYAAEVTVNVGRISGGHVSNQVPDHASATFEARAYDVGLLERTCEAVRAICAEPSVRGAADGAPVRLELAMHRSYPAWPATAATEELAGRYSRLAARRGLAVKPVRRGGGADASVVADLAPTLDGLGMLGGGMHSPQEWADLDAFAPRVRVAADLIVDLCAR